MSQKDERSFLASSAREGESSQPDENNGAFSQALVGLRKEIVGGLLYTHSRANNNTGRLLEATSFLYALIELLSEKGLLTIEELDERKATVATRIEKRFIDKGMGVDLMEPDQDKYAFKSPVKIDCENRIPLCHAACCRLWFPLSRQDVDEGIVQWDWQLPYIIAQDRDGYCKHLERQTYHCQVYSNRPLPCRAFDCRDDKRIWLDFENRLINPDLEAQFQGLPPRDSASRLSPESDPGRSKPVQE
ncbi:MAG TPA: YkgJ family cysteine cluster protein [Anaerolineales bacterium]|nr:YkgJ family cysteine cluster protein [Anaerolineales bacterium]